MAAKSDSRKYEPSKKLISFHIRGFQYWDGALVLDKLKAGNELSLCAEPDNPHDPQAIAVYYDDTKLGYVPAGETDFFSTMFFFGHEDSFEARVVQVDPEAAPWEQVRMGIYVTDVR